MRAFASIQGKQMVLERLRYFLRLGRFAFRERMAALKAMAKRGKERLWLEPGEIEDAVQLNGGVMTDSFERDIAARVERSGGLWNRPNNWFRRSGGRGICSELTLGSQTDRLLLK